MLTNRESIVRIQEREMVDVVIDISCLEKKILEDQQRREESENVKEAEVELVGEDEELGGSEVAEIEEEDQGYEIDAEGAIEHGDETVEPRRRLIMAYNILKDLESRSKEISESVQNWDKIRDDALQNFMTRTGLLLALAGSLFAVIANQSVSCYRTHMIVYILFSFIEIGTGVLLSYFMWQLKQISTHARHLRNMVNLWTNDMDMFIYSAEMTVPKPKHPSPGSYASILQGSTKWPNMNGRIRQLFCPVPHKNPNKTMFFIFGIIVCVLLAGGIIPAILASAKCG